MNEVAKILPYRKAVNGTAALELAPDSREGNLAVIVEFPGTLRAGSLGGHGEPACGASAPHHARTRPNRIVETGARLLRRIRGVLAASEMYCSLRFEDARGVAYGKLARPHVQALVSSGTAVAVLSIAFGA